jgi:hypothetical protein
MVFVQFGRTNTGEFLNTLVPEVYFYYFHCEGERKNKPLEPG